MHRFRSSLVALTLSTLISLLTVAAALAESVPPIPR
jgi:hypothetical protein